MISASITKLARFPLSALALFCAMTGAAHAGTATSITGLYTTGIDGNNDGRDDNWNYGNADAYVVSGSDRRDNGWYSAGNGTRWISAAQDGSTGLGSGTYTYTLTFNIAGTGSGAVNNVNVFMTLSVDDSAVITVNGGSGVSTTGNSQWSRSQNLTLSNGFVIGSNTITITVSNSGAGPSGVLVSSISGVVVPEVGTWVPLAIALGLLAWARLRPKKHNLPAAV